MITVHEKSYGRQVNVYAAEYMGHTLLHIREWYRDKDGNDKPGKGIAVPLEKAVAIKEAIDRVIGETL